MHAVGIDLGTTYSCLSYLTPKGEPVTLPNSEGELATPSVVLFDGDNPIVGTEALRTAVSQPERVIQNAKRYMGDRQKFWVVDGKVHRPPDISALILRKLLDAAEERLGPVRHAVITVPAQFGDLQRQDTAEAGRMAGLERVDIINEPVAAALCYVLSEGMWFAELAADQTVMVFDLGGGTFDLSLVRYNKEEVNVIASGGDLQMGGLDWKRRMEQFACEALLKQPQAELLTSDLVNRCEQITRQMLKVRDMGWAHVDAVLVTGGATRMPMIRRMLQQISGTTLNTSLSPDQSIAHGAAYYAGMLLSGKKFGSSSLGKEATARLARFKQVSVNARALGILVRDKESSLRVPHYLLPANTPLPCAFRQTFGTVVRNQKRVHLHIVESGANPEQPFVKLGACVIEELPPDLPEAAPVEVTIRYDEQARVHVDAKDVTSGKMAKAIIVREENLAHLPSDQARAADVSLAPQVQVPASAAAPPALPVGASTFRPARKQSKKRTRAASNRKTPVSPSAPVLDRAERPVPLCNDCGEPLDARGVCTACGKKTDSASKRRATKKKKKGMRPKPAVAPPPVDDAEIMNLEANVARTEPMKTPKKPRPSRKKKPPSDEIRQGEQEFWQS